jgi:crossover junction endodeoxyribonuclease RusA
VLKRQWDITYPSRGWSLNAERTWHYHKRNNAVKLWRSFFKEEAERLEIPRLDRISVEVFSTFGTRALQDPGNNMPAVKAAIDGIVDAGVVDDDVPEFIHSITFYAAKYVKGYDSVCLRITEQ